jgi:uncharacterized RDD family membrane protein YckC
MSYTQAPPEPVSTGNGPSGPRAGFWRRFAAAFIDGLLIGIVASVVLAVIGGSIAVRELIQIVLSIGYFAYFEGSTGQTLGKRALGIRVIDFNGGGVIGYQRAAVRYLASIVSAICLFIGYLWMLWDKEKQTWHDKLSNSVVVPASDYPVS